MMRIFSILTVAVLMAACNNKSKKTEGPDSTATIVKDKNETAKDNEKMLHDLEAMTPLSEKQIEAMIPESIMDAPRYNLSSSEAMGATMAMGEYRMNDSTTLELDITDCAGPAGAGIYNLQFAGLLDYSTDNPTEYTKVTDFNGSKAIESCQKENMFCSLTYFTGGRFLVLVQAKHIGMDRLKQVANSIKIK